MINAERQTLSESHRAEQKHKEGCLVRWITKTLPAMSQGRRNEFWTNLSANSSPEYAEKLKNEAKSLWNSMTPEQQSKIKLSASQSQAPQSRKPGPGSQSAAHSRRRELGSMRN